MRRQTRNTVLLCLAVAALALLALWQLRRESGDDMPPLLDDVDANGVRTLDVHGSDGVARRFERVPQGWRMRAPYDLPANAESVQRLLAIVAAPVRKHLAADELDLKKVGLDPPQATLTFDAAPSRSLQFGTTDAINGDRYVRRGNEVLLVPDRFSAWLFAPAESELDRHIFPGGEVRTVRLDGVDRPDLVRAWYDMRAARVGVAAQVPAPAGALRHVELSGDGAPLALALWRCGADYCVQRHDPELVYVFEEAAAQALLAEPAR